MYTSPNQGRGQINEFLASVLPYMCWSGEFDHEPHPPLVESAAPVFVHLWEVQRYMVIDDHMLHLGPCPADLIISFRQLPNVVVASDHGINKSLSAPQLEHLQNEALLHYRGFP